jgi:hypothetical protein
MDNHVRPRPAHRRRNLIGIQRVRDHRHSAQLADHRLLGFAAGHARDLMTRGNQTRHQLLSDRSRRSGHKHSHHQVLGCVIVYIHTTRQKPRL